jgi:hypothetical protein
MQSDIDRRAAGKIATGASRSGPLSQPTNRVCLGLLILWHTDV